MLIKSVIYMSCRQKTWKNRRTYTLCVQSSIFWGIHIFIPTQANYKFSISFFTPFDKLVISWYSWIMSHVLLTALLNVHPSTAIRMMSVKYKIHACNMMQDIFLYYLRDKPEVCSINRWCFTCIKNILNTASTLHIFCFIFHTNLSTTKKLIKRFWWRNKL